jgi:hypothetical protein
LLEALARNDTDESPIEVAVNGNAADTVNDFMRHLAKVLPHTRRVPCPLAKEAGSGSAILLSRNHLRRLIS